MNLQIAKSLIASDDPADVTRGLAFMQSDGSLAELQAVMAHIKSPQPIVQKTAIDATAGIILRNLIQYFSNIQTNVRESLAKLLQKLDPNVINRIAKELYSDNEDVRLRALQVLGMLGKGSKVLQALSEMVKDRDKKVRATAIHLLGKAVQGKDMSMVLALLNDEDQRVRANTIEAVEEIGNPNAVGLLQRFRKDKSNRIRGNALKALWNLGQKDIMDDLKEMLNSENYLDRASAAWVMGETGKDNREMIDILASYAQDSNKLVRENVIKAQIKIGGDIAEKYLQYLCEEEEVEDARKALKR